MDRILLKRVLPEVFVGEENSDRISGSDIWLSADLALDRGCRLVIDAESGSGKSSLVSYIYGERTDYHGRIYFDDKDIRSFGIRKWCEIRTRHIALLAQDMRLFPELTALDNVLIKNQLTDTFTVDEIKDMLCRLGLSDRLHTLCGRMSIGQQQRVAIVRTLCQPFDFVILDEPVSHLDETKNAAAARLVEEVASAQGAGIIVTSVGNPLAIGNPSVYSL